MILSDVRELLRCTVFTGEDSLGHPVMFGCASDLMSDVLAFSRSGALLLTGLVSVQTVQTSHIADIVGIVIVRGKTPDASVVELAKRNRMPLLGTPYSMYEACGILYRAGISSTMQCPETPDRSQPA
jgi:hypothetical protein